MSCNQLFEPHTTLWKAVLARFPTPYRELVPVTISKFYDSSRETCEILNPFPTPEISSRAQSTPCTLRPATAPRPLGLGGRPRAHPDRTRARYNRTRVGEV